MSKMTDLEWFEVEKYVTPPIVRKLKRLEAQLAEANAGMNNLAKRLCLNHAATMCGERNQRNDGKCEICEMQAKMAAITALRREYIDALDSGYDVLASHATDKIREAINPPQ